ncbi:exported hypothetical protein [Azospirillaceae bacterium]
MRALLFGLVLSVFLISGAAWAQPSSFAGNCVRPSTPVCAESDTTFLNADRMNLCQNDVKQFVAATTSYLQCLSSEHVQTNQEMLSVVERFNCRLMGKAECKSEGVQ